ncbi:MAG: tRNA dihydrouridine synthase DusB [Christensenellales bacterium]
MNIGNISLDGNVFLAPMAGITDKPFRQLCRELGCDLTYTEMVSAKGVQYGSKGSVRLLDTKGEYPCAVQLFGSDRDIVANTAKRVCEENEGEAVLIDLNMGCPVPKVVQNGEGSALMKDLPKAAAIIEAAAKSSSLPVSVKFRKGWDEDSVNALAFAHMAQESGAALVTVHGRVRSQFFGGKADWEILREIKQSVSIPVVGSGDVLTAEDAQKLLSYTGCDGVMVARGALGNPWIFSQIKALRQNSRMVVSDEEKKALILRHAKMLCDYKGEKIGVLEMRKHGGWYAKGCHDASRFRQELNACETYAQLVNAVCNFFKPETKDEK